jgi:elongation factor Ts
MQIAAMAPLFVNRDSVAADAKAKQADIFDGQLAEEGKPEAVRPKIVEGKINKWMKEICLVEQPSVLDGDKTVAELAQELGKAVGTSVEIVGLVRYERGEGIEVPEGPDFAEEARKMAGG